MNVEIGTEAVQLPEKEYIHGFFLAVWISRSLFPFPQGEAFTMLAIGKGLPHRIGLDRVNFLLSIYTGCIPCWSSY
jgi:hypothetical protein